MKKTLIVFLVFSLFAVLFARYVYRQPFRDFHCKGMMIFHAKTTQGRFSYTAEANMFFIGAHDGFYALNGTFTHDGQTFNLHRTQFFTYRKKGRQDVYEIVITREIIANLDNTPRSVADPILMPVGGSVLPRFRRIDKHAILVSMISSPFFICAEE
ncbi:FidL-like protein [Martelella alba]|uniref:FidL-like membrane protein n=1 Tax=Martelella alba TaxID=2590451 RepID=A0ABY2SLD0_9HYPH|nr:FidL-like protein [Martelella alba]TKI06541.1 hypothetical protein FCN80_09830 [Martelella alba]